MALLATQRALAPAPSRAGPFHHHRRARSRPAKLPILPLELNGLPYRQRTSTHPAPRSARSFPRDLPHRSRPPFPALPRSHSPKKGCDLLVQAFAEICANQPDLDLVIAGPDPNDWRPKLEVIAARAGRPTGRIHWPGMLQGAAKWGSLRRLQRLHPHLAPGKFRPAVVEALACGRPVLLTERVNIAADLAAAGCALVAPDTLDGARSLLTRWLATLPDDRTAMSTRAQATFSERYDMRHNAAAVYDAFTHSAESIAHTKLRRQPRHTDPQAHSTP